MTGFRIHKNNIKFKISLLIIVAGAVVILFLLPLFANYDTIDSQNILKIEKNTKVSNIFASPDSREKFVSVAIGKNEDGVLNLDLPEAFHFDGLSFYFVGDLTKQPSVGAKKIVIYYEDKYGQLKLFDSAENNNQSYYRFFSKHGIETSRLQLRFSEPFYYNLEGGGDVRINDLHLYNKTKTSLFNSLNSNFHFYSQSAGMYIFYYFVFLALLFIPGFVTLFSFSKRFNLNFDSEFILILSPVFGILVMFLATILFLITDFKIVMYIYPAVALLFAIEFIRRKLYRELYKNYLVISFMLIALLCIFLVVVQRDYYFNLQYLGTYLDNLKPIPIDGYPGYFVDNLFPWRIARVYLHDYALNSPEVRNLLTETTIYDRTPVLPMISANIMSIFGEGHFVFQRFLEILAVLFIGAYYSLVRRYFSIKTAVISAFLVVLNVPIFFIAQNAEIYYKFFSIYPVLLALIVFFFFKRYANFIVGLLLALAFLIHPSTLIYSAVILLLYIFRYKSTKDLLQNIYPVISILLFVFAIWFLVPSFVKDSVTNANNHSFYISEASKIGKNFILAKTYNLISLFTPAIFKIGEGPKEAFSIKYLFSHLFLRFSIISNLTPVFFLLLPFYFVKKYREARKWVFISISPLMVYWLLYLNQADFFFQYGGAYFILYPFVIPLCLAFVTNYLLKDKATYKTIILASYIVWMLLNLYYLSGIFEKITSPQLIISGLSWLILLVYCSLSVLLFQKISDKKL